MPPPKGKGRILCKDHEDTRETSVHHEGRLLRKIGEERFLTRFVEKTFQKSP